jgi:cytochrome d ubiquinol oxidase subunit II
MGGVASLLLFLSHGASFLALRTKGELEERSEALAQRLAPAAAGAVCVFAVWTVARQAGADGVEIPSAVLCALAGAAAIGAILRRGGARFGLSALTIVALFAALFVELYPNAIVSSGPGPDLSLYAASSTHYTLTVMTVVAVAMVPIVLAYQAWTYWVFRARLGAEDFEGVHSPIDLLARHGSTDQPPEPVGTSR